MAATDKDRILKEQQMRASINAKLIETGERERYGLSVDLVSLVGFKELDLDYFYGSIDSRSCCNKSSSSVDGGTK